MGEGSGHFTRRLRARRRDGSTSIAFTESCARTLTATGHTSASKILTGVELVRVSRPRAGRHSLQLEINKRLYMDEAKRERNAGFAPLQRKLHNLIEAIVDYIGKEVRRG